jgi:hypothetical protein
MNPVPREPRPILVTDLFPPVLESLLALLSSLTDEEWNAPVAAAGWQLYLDLPKRPDAEVVLD